MSLDSPLSRAHNLCQIGIPHVPRQMAPTLGVAVEDDEAFDHPSPHVHDDSVLCQHFFVL